MHLSTGEIEAEHGADPAEVVVASRGLERAAHAGFEGSGGGECIYAGGSAPRDAHTGWWYSDGHRLILYSEATAQGIAKFGSHWTFMTGNFAKFPL